jgi:hypothetical protein
MVFPVSRALAFLVEASLPLARGRCPPYCIFTRFLPSVFWYIACCCKSWIQSQRPPLWELGLFPWSFCCRLSHFILVGSLQSREVVKMGVLWDLWAASEWVSVTTHVWCSSRKFSLLGITWLSFPGASSLSWGWSSISACWGISMASVNVSLCS